MSDRFEELAEKVLLTLVGADASLASSAYVRLSMEITEGFLGALDRRKLAQIEEFGITAQEAEQVRLGNPIEAIKLVRERTGMSLKESKDLVDKYRGIIK